MKNYGKKIAKEVRKNILLEKAYDLFTYTALIAMGLGIAVVVTEMII